MGAVDGEEGVCRIKMDNMEIKVIKKSKLGVMLHRQNAHLLTVNSAFASVASLDLEIFNNFY